MVVLHFHGKIGTLFSLNSKKILCNDRDAEYVAEILNEALFVRIKFFSTN